MLNRIALSQSGFHFDPLAIVCSRLFWCAIVVLAVSARHLYGNGQDLLSGIGGSDDAMRLIQVRDFLATGNWFDRTIYQVGAPDTLISHWSRLLDVPLALMVATFGAFVSAEHAEIAARILWPSLLLVALTYFTVREAKRQAGLYAAIAVLALVLNGVAVTFQFSPGRIDHHNVQVLCAVVGLFLLHRSITEPRLGWPAGALLGMGLAVGLEALFLVGAIVGIAALCAGFDRTMRIGVTRAVTACAGVVAACFFATTAPSQWSLMFCDASALNLVVLLGLGSATLLLLTTVLPQATATQWIAGLGVGGAVAAAAYLALEPACVAGPFGQADPRIGPIWLHRVIETQSILQLAEKTPAGALSFLLFVALGVALQARTFNQRRDLPSFLAFVTLVLAAVFSSIFVKLMSYAMWLSLLSIAVWIARLPAIGEIPARTVRFGAMFLFSQGTLLLIISNVVGMFSTIEANAIEKLTVRSEICQRHEHYDRLRALPAGLIASEIDLGPFIALNTRHRVVVAPYHRIDKSIVAAYEILTSAPRKSERVLRRLGVDYVVVCQRTPQHLEGMDTSSFMHALQTGGTLTFLEPVAAEDQASPIKIWRVTPAR